MKNGSTIKKIIKAIVPPIVWDVLAELRNRGTLRFFGKTFVGVFSKFEEVGRHFHGVVSYNSEESERKEVAHAAESRAAAANARKGVAPKPSEHHAFLCELAAALPDAAPTILDVGGGTGDTLAHLIYSCPQKKPRLIVHELPPIAAAGRKVFSGEEAISFVDKIADVSSKKLDIVFFGSSIQYFEDYKLFLNGIAALRPRIIAIAYTAVTDAPTFVTAHINARRRIIPIKIINRAELVAHLNSLGFGLTYCGKPKTEIHFDNFPAPQNTSSLMNTVFTAK